MESNKRKADDLDDEATLEKKVKRTRLFFDTANLFCPISKRLMLYPMFCDDGFTYEKFYIEKTINDIGISPLTGQKISHCYKNIIVAQIIDQLIKSNDKYKVLQFNESYYTDYAENKKTAVEYLDKNNFTEFSKLMNTKLCDEYKKVDSSYYNRHEQKTIGKHIFELCSDQEALNKILDNSEDLDSILHNTDSAIHLAQQGHPIAIISLIKKGIILYNLNEKNESFMDFLFKRNITKTEIVSCILENDKFDPTLINEDNHMHILEMILILYNVSHISKIIDAFIKINKSVTVMNAVLLFGDMASILHVLDNYDIINVLSEEDILCNLLSNTMENKNKVEIIKHINTKYKV